MFESPGVEEKSKTDAVIVNGVRQKDDKGIPKFTVEEIAFAKELLRGIAEREAESEFTQFLKDIEENRKYARGKQHDDGKGGLVRANLIHAELKKAVNETYAKDPDFTCVPTDTVAKERYETWKNVGRTIELLLKNQFAPAQANLKSVAKRAVRAADTTGFGWAKVVYQKELARDPLIDTRIRDVQDDIQRLERLRMETDENNPEYVAGDIDARKEELLQQVKTLEEQVEVSRSRGLVITLRPSENVIFPGSVRDPSEIRKGAWISDKIWMSVEQCKERFGFCPGTATKYSVDKKNINAAGTKPEDTQQLVCVHELWRLDDSRIYTLVVGFDGWLREPYSPKEVGESFYGFFPLTFDIVDGSPIPLPLVTQLRDLQDEHNTARTNFREHREKSVPFNVAHGGELNVEDTGKLTNPGFMETVVLKSAPSGQPLDAVFKPVQNPPIDPSVYSTEHVRSDWEQVTHRGDAARGTVAKAKTAQEAGILQENLQVDTSERRDVIEDWFREIAQYSAEILLSEMNAAEVKKIVGDSAAWPELTREDTFNLVQLEIKAGSSGKPNQQQELQRWVQMLPELREGLMAVIEMEAAGKLRQSQLMMRLLRESLLRFDERINLDELLPKADTEGQQQPNPEAMQEQMVAAQQQLETQKKQMLDDVSREKESAMLEVKKTTAEQQQQIQSRMQQLYSVENTITKKIAELDAAETMSDVMAKKHLTEIKMALSQLKLAKADETKSGDA